MNQKIKSSSKGSQQRALDIELQLLPQKKKSISTIKRERSNESKKQKGNSKSPFSRYKRTGSKKMIQKNRVYKPFEVPPDFELAELHGKAKKIGKINRYMKQLEEGKCCICCNLPYSKTPFKIGEDIDKFASLGSAFSLFFYYNKQMIFLLSSTFLLAGVSNLIQTYTECDNFNSKCQSFMGIIYSREKALNCLDEFSKRDMFNMVIFWILYFGVLISKISQDRKDISLQKKTLFHSQYSILVTGDQSKSKEEDLKEFLSERLIFGKKIEIASVNRAYKIQEYYRLARERIKIINDFEKLLSSNEDMEDQQKYHQLQSRRMKKRNDIQLPFIDVESKEYLEKKAKLEKQMELNLKQISILEKKYSRRNNSEIKTEYVFVSFENQADCLEVKKRYFDRAFKNTLVFEGKELAFKEAPEPLDVIWENLETSSSVKIFRRSLFFVLAIIMMSVSLMGISALTKWQRQILLDRSPDSDFKNTVLSYLLSLFCMILMSLINGLLNLAVNFFSEFERHSTFTQKSVSISEKLTWIQFLNTALVPFVIIVILLPTDQEMNSSFNRKEYLTFALSDIFFILIGDALFLPFLIMYSPVYLYKQVKKWWYIKRRKTCRQTQQQLNQIFEDPEFKIEEYYSVLNRIILCSFFYATMLSLGLLLSCVSILALYWSFKFSFVSHSAYPKCLSNNLHSSMQGIMFFLPLIFTIGNLSYGYVFLLCTPSSLFSVYNIIELSFGTALLIFRPILFQIFQFATPKVILSNESINKYSFKKRFMGLTYQQTNPITRVLQGTYNKQTDIMLSSAFSATPTSNLKIFENGFSDKKKKTKQPNIGQSKLFSSILENITTKVEVPPKDVGKKDKNSKIIEVSEEEENERLSNISDFFPVGSQKSVSCSESEINNLIEDVQAQNIIQNNQQGVLLSYNFGNSKLESKNEEPAVAEEQNEEGQPKRLLKNLTLSKQCSLQEQSAFESDQRCKIKYKTELRQITSSSIMDYAFTNEILGRERHNLIISQMFQRNKQGDGQDKNEESEIEESESERNEGEEESDFENNEEDSQELKEICKK